MRIPQRLWTHLRVFVRARQNRGDLPRWLARRPLIGLAHSSYEAALLLSGRAPTELKLLAGTKAAMLTGCEFCLDVADSLGRQDGLSEEKLVALARYRDSELYSPLEKLCLQLAEEMSRTPPVISEGLRDDLLRHLTRGQLAEIAAEIAWENHRGRLNQALGVRPMDTAGGARCLLPEPLPGLEPEGSRPGAG